jgi:hypothetical protein
MMSVNYPFGTLMDRFRTLLICGILLIKRLFCYSYGLFSGKDACFTPSAMILHHIWCKIDARNSASTRLDKFMIRMSKWRQTQPSW